MNARLAEINSELAEVKAKIDAAYWRFCRCARAKPPSLAEPDAYKRRKELEEERRTLLRG